MQLISPVMCVVLLCTVAATSTPGGARVNVNNVNIQPYLGCMMMHRSSAQRDVAKVLTTQYALQLNLRAL